MKNITKYAAIMTLAGTIAGCDTQPQANDIDAKVDSLYAKMTNEERVAQLCGIYMTQFFDEDNKLMPEKCAEIIPNGVGHCSQFMQRKTHLCHGAGGRFGI